MKRLLLLLCIALSFSDAFAQGLKPITVVRRGDSGIVYGKLVDSTGQPFGGGGGKTLTVGTPPQRIGVLMDHDWTVNSGVSDWAVGSGFSSSYSSGVTKINGSNQWAPNNSHLVNNQSTPWPGGLQYQGARFPFEDITVKIRVRINTITDSTVIAVTHGANGFFFSYPETIAWDLTNRYTQGRVKLGLGEIYNFAQAGDSTERCPIAVGDTVELYYVKKGWNVTAGIWNITKDKRTAVHFARKFSGQGGYYNFMFIKGGTAAWDLHRTTISSDAIVGADVCFLGNSLTNGDGASSEARRYPNLVMNGNYNHYNVVSLPSVTPEYVATSGIDTEVIHYYQPKKVVIELGPNSWGEVQIGASFTPVTMRNAIDSIRRRFQRAGIDVTIVGHIPRHVSTAKEWRDTLRNFCTRNAIDYVEIFDPLKTSGDLMAGKYTKDGLHPNDSGHIIIANAIVSTVGYKLRQKIAEDSIRRVVVYNTPVGTHMNTPLLKGQDRYGSEVLVPNYAYDASNVILNVMSESVADGQAPYTISQDAWIHVKKPIESDSAFFLNGVGAAWVGYNGAGTKSIVMTPRGKGGIGWPQVFGKVAGQNIIIETYGEGPMNITGRGWIKLGGQMADSVWGDRVFEVGMSSAGYVSTLTGATDVINIGKSSGHTTASRAILLGGSDAGWGNYADRVIIGYGFDGGVPASSGVVAFQAIFTGVQQNYLGGVSSYNGGVIYHGASNLNGGNTNGFTVTHRASPGNGSGNGGEWKIQTTTPNNHGTWVDRITAQNDVLTFNGKYIFAGITEYADNAAALSGGLVTGQLYRTGDALKIVH